MTPSPWARVAPRGARRIGAAAALALALPLALTAILSGSCSLVDLYDGARDAAAEGQGGASSSSATVSSSGGGGAGGTGGAPDASDGGEPDAPSPCPPDMVVVATSADAGYCVDRTEVNNLAYAQFIAGGDASAPQAPAGRCDWNTSYAPAVALDAGDDLPVLGLDWCDAYAYCAWAGKRLCGAVGGGPIPSSQRDLTASQWFRACSRGDTRLYPYGNTFNLSACADCNPDAGCAFDAAAPPSSAVAVGSKKGCAGGYTGLFDMSGNAAEWEDGCDDAGVRPDAADDAGHPVPDHAYDLCYHRGGSYADHPTPSGSACLACSTAGCSAAADVRSRRPHDVGLRCCLDY